MWTNPIWWSTLAWKVQGVHDLFLRRTGGQENHWEKRALRRRLKKSKRRRKAKRKRTWKRGKSGRRWPASRGISTRTIPSCGCRWSWQMKCSHLSTTRCPSIAKNSSYNGSISSGASCGLGGSSFDLNVFLCDFAAHPIKKCFELGSVWNIETREFHHSNRDFSIVTFHHFKVYRWANLFEGVRLSWEHRWFALSRSGNVSGERRGWTCRAAVSGVLDGTKLKSTSKDGLDLVAMMREESWS